MFNKSAVPWRKQHSSDFKEQFTPLNGLFVLDGIFTLTLHKFLSSSQAVMSEIVAFSGQMLDACLSGAEIPFQRGYLMLDI
ncbi:hypothetical protein D1BOALGB6SA_2151 [Olavius sp. associated proteobacterium Delta 1]|nr:hypothetical protein D1BOALGB6SA_2151 [Olavius sp. associated proteobacterium Delta 1]